MRLRLPSTALVAGLATVLGTLVATGPMTGAATATATPTAGHHAPRPTATARHHGVTAAEGGYMGWRTGTTAARSVQPSVMSTTASVAGIDVSHYQGTVNWATQWNNGKRFAYIKATEGTYNTQTTFASQYSGSYKQGFIRGAYHFANPSDSSAAAQADFFVAHGGRWSRDGKTLPGVLDIEYNPYGGTCYGKTRSGMVTWIKNFLARYKTLTGRDAVIYTTTDWWKTCTGNTTAFSRTNPLWVARYSSTVGTLPGSWPYYTFWQWTSSPLDQDRFNGSLDRLKALALG